MADNLISLPVFPPDALYGQNVAIHYLDRVLYRRVIFCEPIPWFQFLNIGPIALQTQSNRTAANNLAQYTGEWAQFRWFPMDYQQVRMYLPQSQGKWTMRNIQVPLDSNIIFRNPDLSMTEFHVWEDSVPWFEAMNIGDYAANGCRLMAGGFRYIGRDIAKMPNGAAILRSINDDKIPCKHVWASGLASTPEG